MLTANYSRRFWAIPTADSTDTSVGTAASAVRGPRGPMSGPLVMKLPLFESDSRGRLSPH